MSKDITFRFDLREKVIIKEIQRPGVIQAAMMDSLGIQYNVSYWDNSERNSCWLPEEELESRS